MAKNDPKTLLETLNERSREILRHVVDAYVETGEPIGSKSVMQRMGMQVSSATIRNVMADLTASGLLYSPHTSAGRLPTETGMRLFVDGLLELGPLGQEERQQIEARCRHAGRDIKEMLREASHMLSGLSSCAGLVMAPKLDRPLKQIEFVNLAPGRALVVMVTIDGLVENRVIEVPLGVPTSSLIQAANFLNSRLQDQTLSEAQSQIQQEISNNRAQLDELSAKVVQAGLASWSGFGKDGGQLIIRGQSHLLKSVQGTEDLERIRALFTALEEQESLLNLVDATAKGEGVQIFIGAENSLFNITGCSMVITPFANGQDQIIGAIGVVGPTRLNYGRIIPMVDYTAKVISRLLG